MSQNIQLTEELSSQQVIDLGRKLDEVETAASRLNLTKCSKTARQVRTRLDLLMLDVLEAKAILDGG